MDSITLGDWIAIVICVFLFLWFVFWATSGDPIAMYDDDDEIPRSDPAAMRSDAEHPSERMTGKMPELSAGYVGGIDLANGPDRTAIQIRCGTCHAVLRPHRLFGTTCDCVVNPRTLTDREILEDEFDLNKPRDPERYARYELLKRLEATGHMSDDEARELHNLKLTLGRFT